MAEFNPTEQEQLRGREGYTRYLIGAVILHNPSHLQELHGRELDPEKDKRIIVLYAESLMLGGLKNVIRFANPPDVRGALANMEGRYLEAFPNMQATVDSTFEHDNERVNKLNSGLSILRPAPMLDETIYGYICHSRLAKLSTLRLLDSFLPADELVDILRGRTLEYLSNEDKTLSELTGLDAS